MSSRIEQEHGFEREPQMNPLFDEFPPVTPQEWAEAAGILDPSGDIKMPNEWRIETIDRIIHDPICWTEATATVPTDPPRPHSPSLLRAWNWETIPTITVHKDGNWSNFLSNAIKNGAHGAELHLDGRSPIDFITNLDALVPPDFTILLSGDTSQLDGSDTPTISGILLHPLASNNPSSMLTRIAERLEKHPAQLTIHADAGAFGMAYATASDELAYALATAVEYTRHMIERGVPIDQVAQAMRMVLPLGGHVFFLEVAKIKAIRRLWSFAVEAFGGQTRSLHVHSRGNLWNKSKIGTKLNIARSATEGLAAVIGGCDSLDLSPHETSDTGYRIALNTQHILREEVGLDRVADPASGSRLVESLTNQLIHAAWAEFQEIEILGGMQAALDTGRLKSRVDAATEIRQQRLKDGKEILVGVNRFRTETQSS